jgi:AraC-like DNA-binding protein
VAANANKTSFAYLPVSDAVLGLGLYLTGAGTDRIPAGGAYPRQRHPDLYHFNWTTGRVLPEYQFVFIRAGRGEFESQATGRCDVLPGTILMLFPDVWHRYRPAPETGWTESWISLGGDLPFNWQLRGLIRPAQAVCQLDHPETVVEHYEAIIRFVTEHPDRQTPALAARAMMIASAVMDHSDRFSTTAVAGGRRDCDDSLVTAALHVIWNHGHRRISVAEIARSIGSNRRTLERRFFACRGRTLLCELTQCRLHRAKRLLSETHLPIKRVAHSAGFSSVVRLCKVFKQEADLTPGDYRRRAIQARETGKRRSARKERSNV